MSDTLQQCVTESQALLQDAEETRDRYAKARQELEQAECGLRVAEMQLEQAVSELRSLEGFSLTGVILGILGTRRERIEQTRANAAELEERYESCKTTLAEVSRRVDELTRQIDSAESSHAALLAEKLRDIEASGGEPAERLRQLDAEIDDLKSTVKTGETTLKAAEEARRDLLDESETVAALGRRRVPGGSRTMRAIVNTRRGKTAEPCAERVCQSIGRLRRRLAEFIEQLGEKSAHDLVDAGDSLERLAETFNGASLQCTATTNEFERQIRAARDLIEQRLSTARERVAELERERRGLIEEV